MNSPSESFLSMQLRSEAEYKYHSKQDCDCKKQEIYVMKCFLCGKAFGTKLFSLAYGNAASSLHQCRIPYYQYLSFPGLYHRICWDLKLDKLNIKPRIEEVARITIGECLMDEFCPYDKEFLRVQKEYEGG